MKIIVAMGALGVPMLAAAGGGGRAAVRVTPLQKVLQLLDDLQAKGKKSKHEEEVEFAEFSQWCDSTRQATTKSISQAKDQLMQLEAAIAKAGADAEQLAAEGADLDASVAQAQGELKEATAVREKEHADYSDTHADLSESIDAIERAISVLKSREADVPQSLLQVQNIPGLPKEAKSTVESFIAMADEGELAAPSANAYENQSGGVVGLLEKLRHKFQDQRLALQKAEMNAKANYEMLAQNLKDNIKEDSKRSKDKSAQRAQRLESAAIAKGEHEATETTKAEDEKKLDDTLASCHTRSEEFEKNQVVRAEEVKAIQQAMEILQSDDVTGNADKHLPQLAQTAVRGSALAQLLRGGEAPQVSQVRERLAGFLQGRAQALGSRYLALVASHASADPFGKVKKMVKDLIVKLMEQANSEADHKAYCDTELATNKATRENKQSEVDELTASVDKHVADSARLGEELAELSDALAQLRREQAEATKIRSQEKTTNAATIADAKVAQEAVERATRVLKDFYSKAASGEVALVQGGLSQAMGQASQEPYTGMQSSSGGIVGFLEVILSDFARLEAETSTAEDQAASAYEKFMDESNEDAAVKETESKHKTARRRGVDAETESLRKELELTQEELGAASDYYDKLKPDCVDNGLSYSDRVRMREEEIQSLKEALNILDQQDLA